jgi:adenylate cyclase
MTSLRVFGSPWQGRVLALGLALAVVLLMRGMFPGVLDSLDERAGDFFWRAFPVETQERRVIVVDIDEASLAEVGPWPWPRERLEALSGKLAALGAGTQIYDIVLPDARPGDDRLAAEFARHPVVLAQIFALGNEEPSAAGQIHGALTSPACAAPVPQASGFIGNTAALVASPAMAVGHITPRISDDGSVRRLPALICFENRTYPALGLAALLKSAGVPPIMSIVPGTAWLDPPYRLTHSALQGFQVPLDGNGDIRLSYSLSRKAFISVPAADVLAGRAPAEFFKGAWVLVGASAFGIGDAVPTPHGGAVSGVEVHAQFITALLDNRLPYTPRSAPAIQILMAALAAGALLLLLARRHRLPVVSLPLVGLLLGLLMLVVHARGLIGGNLWLGWADPAVFSLCAGLLLGVAEHARTRVEREALFRNLSSYLPRAVASDIAYREPSDAIDARRCDITVLYADLRNFSAYCENRPPEEAAAILHAFFTLVDRVVDLHHGVVEEYAGDDVMAIWDSSPAQVAQALAAAAQIIEEGAALLPMPPPPGLEALGIGIGIETGSALVGSFGPARRRTHTALGETVTIATRLQALTGELAEPIILGPAAAALLPAEPLVPLGVFLLEGLNQSRNIFAFRPAAGPEGLSQAPNVIAFRPPARSAR